MSREDPAYDECPSSRNGRHRLDWLVVGFLFLATVGLGCWIGLRQIEQRTRDNVGDSLSVVLNTTQDSLHEWFRAESNFAQQLADHPEVRAATQELLATPPTAEALQGHRAFRDLRAFFEVRVSNQMKSGIFLISPDELSLFSMRDANVGTRNLIAEQRPNRLRLAFAGEPALVTSVISDVPLPGAGDRMTSSLPTMFLATPIKSDDGSIIAVLAVQLDPSTYFTRLFRAGRIGVSGEIYGFDREGRMLSDSRFDSNLVDLGLLKPDGLSILDVRIVDPGRRLSTQHPADQSDEDLPLTLMASHAVQGQAGVNVTGYRDYRGVPVLGGWIWDDLLNFGITCEIDESEALGVFQVTRAIVVTMLAVTTLLAFALVVYMSKVQKFSARKAQEAEILKLNDELEQRIVERTTELETMNKELEAFSYSVSHDLRAPLRAIDGFSMVLLEDYAKQLDKEGQGHLDRIRAATQRMGRLIDDLLGFARVSRQSLRKGPIALGPIIQQAMALLRAEEPDRSIELTLSNLPICLGDADLLGVVWTNLLANAVKFTSKQPVAMIEIGSEIQENECVYFVKDNGAGFDMDYASKLFGVFQRLHSEFEFSGTGIGLATVQRIIRRHGGRIWAEGTVGQGATFYFTLSPKEAGDHAASKE